MFPFPFPSYPHTWEAGCSSRVIWCWRCGEGKAEHLNNLPWDIKNHPKPLCSGIRRIWSGLFRRGEFMPIFIFSGIFWCPCSVRCFYVCYFPSSHDNTRRPSCNLDSELRSPALHTVTGSLATARLHSQSCALQYKYIERQLGSSFR